VNGDPIRFSTVLDTGVFVQTDGDLGRSHSGDAFTEGEYRALVRELLGDRDARAAVRFALGLDPEVDREQVADALLQAIEWGRVRCVRFARTSGHMAMPAATDLAELAEPLDEESDVSTGYIEILLTAHDGAAVSDEPYTILTPTGDELRGRLDARGEAHHDPVDRLVCRVSFPNIDKGDWQAYPGPPPPEPPFVDVIVTDETYTPIAGATWKLEIPGGATESGVTDASGRIFIPNVELASVCRLVVTQRSA
jgi:hypothetical protein